MADGRRDEGFSLVEIIVALGIFLVVTMALLPQMVAGIRSVTTADRETVLKGILQQEADRLRGLPFRVSLGSSGGGTDEDVDLLDLYYPNVRDVAPSAVTCTGSDGYSVPDASWEGYVGVASGRRCDYEPASGTFFRTVGTVSDARLGAVTLVRDLQFLTGGSATTPTAAATAPAGTYDSDRATTNYPPSPQVGVTLTALFTDGGEVKARSLFTQIAKHDSGPTLVRTSVDVAAVEITSTSPLGAVMSLTAGVVGLDSAVGDISTADASLAGVLARVSTGDPASSQFGYGATSATAAPPSVASFATTTDVPDEGVGCADLLCWGTSTVGSDAGAGVAADGGLPTAGTPAGQLRSAVTDTGDAALTFDNVGAGTAAFNLAGRPVVRLVGAAPGVPTVPDQPSTCPLGVHAGARLSGSGYLTTSLHDGSDTVRDTAACGSARSAAVGILPAGGWAPEGVVRVTLNRSYAWCTVTGGAPAGGAALSASVEVSDGAGGYQAAIDAASLSLSTVIPGRGPLGDYLQGWSLGPPTVTTAGSEVSVTASGLVVATQPTRTLADDPAVPDEDSAVVVTLGASSCTSKSAS